MRAPGLTLRRVYVKNLSVHFHWEKSVLRPLRESFPRVDPVRRRQVMAEVAQRILLTLFPREAGALCFETLIGRTVQ